VLVLLIRQRYKVEELRHEVEEMSIAAAREAEAD
jgi:hypothetical protein